MSLIRNHRFLWTNLGHTSTKYGSFRRNFSTKTYPKKKSTFKKIFYAGIISTAVGAYGWTYINSSKEDTWPLLVMKTLPLRTLSRVWGAVNNVELPKFMRAPLYRFWAWKFGCILEEAEAPLSSYPCLAAFFCRGLRPGVRPISEADLVSPVDGEVTVFGEVLEGRLEQIKGMKYHLDGFLGFDIKSRKTRPNSKLYYCVLYLSPGDYHRIHSSSNFLLEDQYHFPGDLFPVLPSLARHVPELFSVNERVNLNGKWDYGYFGLSSVGAYNVGSIKLKFDPDLHTNRSDQQPGSPPLIKKYTKKIQKGEEIARFELGSTVVLVFEADDFTFTINSGDKVKYGQSLGIVPKPKPNNKKQK